MELLFSKKAVNSKALNSCAVFVCFVLLISLSGFLRIPLAFSPVPITLQTVFVLLSAALLTGYSGLGVQMSYISLGLLGLPVFSLAIGAVAYLAGPTGGYIMGFVLASLFLAKMQKYFKSNFALFSSFVIADGIILLSGMLWLKILLGLSMGKAFVMGVVPFIPGDLLKIILAVSLYKALKPKYELYCKK